MRRADGVVAHLFQDAHAAFLTLGIAARTENAVVVVQTTTLEQHLLPVHGQAVGAVCHNADPKGRLSSIPSRRHAAGVQVWSFGTPQLGIGQCNICGRSVRRSQHGVTVQNLDTHRGAALVVHCHANSGRRIGQRGNADALGGQRFRRTFPQPHRAIDARAGIPAAVRLSRVIRHDGEVVLPRMYCPMHIHPKRAVPVGRHRNICIVHSDPGIAVHTLKLQQQAAGRFLLGQSERFGIGIDPAVIVATGGPARGVFVAALPLHGIVGQGHSYGLTALAGEILPAVEIYFLHGCSLFTIPA